MDSGTYITVVYCFITKLPTQWLVLKQQSPFILFMKLEHGQLIFHYVWLQLGWLKAGDDLKAGVQNHLKPPHLLSYLVVDLVSPVESSSEHLQVSYPCGRLDSSQRSGLVESEHLKGTKRNIQHFNDLVSKSYRITSAFFTEFL